VEALVAAFFREVAPDALHDDGAVGADRVLRGELEHVLDAAGALPAAARGEHHLVSGAMRVRDRLHDTRAEGLVLQQHRAVDVERDEQALRRDGGVLGIRRQIVDEVRGLRRVDDLDRPVGGRRSSARGRSCDRLRHLEAAEVGPQHLGDHHRPVGALVRLEERRSIASSRACR
jgi:hypothetical protein